MITISNEKNVPLIQLSEKDRKLILENVLAALIGLDEAVALLSVEPLHGSSSHQFHLSGV